MLMSVHTYMSISCLLSMPLSTFYVGCCRKRAALPEEQYSRLEQDVSYAAQYSSRFSACTYRASQGRWVPTISIRIGVVNEGRMVTDLRFYHDSHPVVWWLLLTCVPANVNNVSKRRATNYMVYTQNVAWAFEKWNICDTIQRYLYRTDIFRTFLKRYEGIERFSNIIFKSVLDRRNIM